MNFERLYEICMQLLMVVGFISTGIVVVGVVIATVLRAFEIILT